MNWRQQGPTGVKPGTNWATNTRAQTLNSEMQAQFRAWG